MAECDLACCVICLLPVWPVSFSASTLCVRQCPYIPIEGSSLRLSLMSHAVGESTSAFSVHTPGHPEDCLWLSHDLLYTLCASGEFQKYLAHKVVNNVHSLLQYRMSVKGWRPWLETRPLRLPPQHKVKVYRSRVQHVLALIAHSINCRLCGELFDSQHFKRDGPFHRRGSSKESKWLMDGNMMSGRRSRRGKMAGGGSQRETKEGGRAVSDEDLRCFHYWLSDASTK